MSRKVLTLIICGILVLVLLGAGAVGGFFYYRNRQVVNALERAEAHYAAERWLPAKLSYRFYLWRRPGDPEVLKKYAGPA